MTNYYNNQNNARMFIDWMIKEIKQDNRCISLSKLMTLERFNNVSKKCILEHLNAHKTMRNINIIGDDIIPLKTPKKRYFVSADEERDINKIINAKKED